MPRYLKSDGIDTKVTDICSFTAVLVEKMEVFSQPPPPIKFIVDRPFLYAILYEDKTLFAGTYTN